MEKAKSVSVGSMVSWNSSGGRASGKVKRIMRNRKKFWNGTAFESFDKNN